MNTLVRFDDGLYYAAPVVRGADYCITFPNDAPPEFSCAASRRTPDEAQMHAERTLQALGITALLAGTPNTEWRYINGTMALAYTLELELLAPLPKTLTAQHHGATLATECLVV